ncbi:MAG: hypothetical protein HZB55_21840 [Deltaproteobacteria bacterium]|nr:hypothetical protein [Deltaproteobacteria bacterium]
MGLFDIFKQVSPIARVELQFQEDFETTSTVAVLVEGRIPSGMEIWIWDLYYAKTLYNIGRCEAAEGVKAHLERWASKWVTPFWSGLPAPAEAFTLDSDLTLSAKSTPRAETYTVDVVPGRKGWPVIQTHLPSQPFKNRAAYSTLAFAQHLIALDQDHFGLELPLHVLAMRKYYADVKPYTALTSVLGAPTHAIQSAMQFMGDYG